MKKVKLIFEQSDNETADLNRNLEKVAGKLAKEKDSGITKEFVSEMVRTIIEKLSLIHI